MADPVRAAQRSVLRIWLDELERLPEYSATNPTGVRHRKAWKMRGRGDRWWVRMYWEIGGRFYILTFWVELLQGPRRPNERSRFPSVYEWTELAEAPRG